MDLSVIDEMASRLRSVGQWDNQLADRCASLTVQIEKAERFAREEGWAFDEIRRPLESWAMCRKLLTVISASRWKTFSDIPAPVEACLSLAVLLHTWERGGVSAPKDIRGMMYGAICVEWPKHSIIIDGCGITGDVPKV